MRIRPRNWSDFQHYKDRSPPWIRLHRSLLDDFDFQRLPVASRALAPMLWLLAAESKDTKTGEIDASPDRLAFRLRMSEQEVRDALKPLIDKEFFSVVHGASDVLAECLQVAVPETETETEDIDQKQDQKLPSSTGEKAPPKQPDPIWDTGLAMLVRKGVPERTARGFLGQLRKACGDDLLAASLLAAAEAQDVSDPCAWLTAASKARKKPQLELVQPEPVRPSSRPLTL